ncbi:hypothetical protein BaRGS_00007354, partial [Batillaria attramentaria]
YLELRFNTPVRLLGSVLLILSTDCFSVTNLNFWGAMIGGGVVVTFYTTLGGMKAVLWTDTFQAIVMLTGLLAVIIQGSIVTGGFARAWDVASQRGRIAFDDFSADPSTRHSFWSVVVGGGTAWISLYGVNQAQVQRALSCPTVKKAKIALWLLPLFVMDILADYPSVPGIFVACVASGSLSTLSSGFNALSAVTMKDFVLPYCCPNLSDSTTTIWTRITVVMFGGITMILAYLVSQLDGVLQVAISVHGILNGPLFGLFLLGMFFPWANSVGAFVGCLSSVAFMGWIGIGAFVHKVRTATPSPLVVAGCNWTEAVTSSNLTTTLTTTVSMLNNSTASDHAISEIPAYSIYTLSYFYYDIVGGVVVVIVGLIVSFLTGYTKPSSLHPHLICPLFDVILPCLPEAVRKPLRFGVNYKKAHESEGHLDSAGRVGNFPEHGNLLETERHSSIKIKNKRPSEQNADAV